MLDEKVGERGEYLVNLGDREGLIPKRLYKTEAGETFCSVSWVFKGAYFQILFISKIAGTD